MQVTYHAAGVGHDRAESNQMNENMQVTYNVKKVCRTAAARSSALSVSFSTCSRYLCVGMSEPAIASDCIGLHQIAISIQSKGTQQPPKSTNVRESPRRENGWWVGGATVVEGMGGRGGPGGGLWL